MTTSSGRSAVVRHGSLWGLHTGPRRTSAGVREPGKPGQEWVAVLDRAARTEHGRLHRVERPAPIAWITSS